MGGLILDSPRSRVSEEEALPQFDKEFCLRVGVTKSENNVELAMLYSCIRDELEISAQRVMGVLNPINW